MMPGHDKKRILVVLIAGIGDLVLASKALRAIRNGFPEAEIHLLTSTDAAPLAKHYDFLSQVWAFPIRELRVSKLHLLGILRILKVLRKISFQEAVNLYHIGSTAGAFKMGALFLFLRATEKTGHDAHGFGSFLTRTVPSDFFQKRHFADSMAELAMFAGGIPDEKGVEVFWDSGCENKWADLIKGKTINRLLIGINPGGDRKNKRWEPRRYAAVADRLTDCFDATILLFGGPGEEGIAREVHGNMKCEAKDLSGKLSLDDLAYLISRLDLLVTNDSAPMHIGAATRTPLIALFGPENPASMGPYTRSDLFRIIHKDVPCRPCVASRCEHIHCLDLIESEEVVDKCIEILKIHKSSVFKE